MIVIVSLLATEYTYAKARVALSSHLSSSSLFESIKGASRGQSRHTYCLLFTVFLQFFSFLSFTNLWTKCRRSATWRSKALVIARPKPSIKEARQRPRQSNSRHRFRWCYNIRVNSLPSSLLYFNRKQSRWCVIFMLGDGRIKYIGG